MHPRLLSELSEPHRLSGVPYRDGEDHEARSLLTSNGYGVDSDQLIELLENETGILQAAAARVLGAAHTRNAIAPLERLAHDTGAEETTRVQAAYALARLGSVDAAELLTGFLVLSPEATPAPLQAAGALARLGDPRGFSGVVEALDSSNPVTAMVACKQLLAYAWPDGRPLPNDRKVDIYRAFARALNRSEGNIVAEAVVQLKDLGTAKALKLLASRGLSREY